MERPCRRTSTASAARSSGKRKPPSVMPRTIMWIGQWNSTYKNSLQWEAERRPMKKDWEIYRDTGILGGYMPECAKLRQNRGRRSRNCFPGHNNTYGGRLHHKTARDADRQQTVLYHVCISGRALRNADGQADCLHRRGTGKGSAQRIKI